MGRGSTELAAAEKATELLESSERQREFAALAKCDEAHDYHMDAAALFERQAKHLCHPAWMAWDKLTWGN